MSKYNQNSNEKYNYTILYNEVKRKYNLTNREYLIIKEMFRNSVRNTYAKGINFLSKKFNISTNTIKKYIKSLSEKDFIWDKSDKNYFLNPSISEMLKPIGDSKWIKIFNEHRLELKLSIEQYSMLYLFYSFSKNRKTKEAYSGYKQYERLFDKSESVFYRVINKLKSSKYITKTRENYIKLDNDLFNWFEFQNN
jgi:predicted transcriptional regulator